LALENNLQAINQNLHSGEFREITGKGHQFASLRLIGPFGGDHSFPQITGFGIQFRCLDHPFVDSFPLVLARQQLKEVDQAEANYLAIAMKVEKPAERLQIVFYHHLDHGVFDYEANSYAAEITAAA
jgi:hypothetical protein